MDNFEIISTLGRGATAEVFSARNLTTKKLVAIKKFDAYLLQDPEIRQRILMEADVLGQLCHPNIVRLIGSHSQGEDLTLELDLVSGVNLTDWNQNFKLPLLEPKLAVLVQIARGLGAAHEKGILHRDLKPENILVSKNGEVKITDFGLARVLNRVTMTKTGVLLGSLAYIAPEIINGEKPTIKSDLFSLGVLTYELLTGQLPFDGESPQTVIQKICSGQYRRAPEINPLIDENLSELIDSCLKVKAEDRLKNVWYYEAKLMDILISTEMAPYSSSLILAEADPGTIHRALKDKLEGLTAKIEATRSLLEKRPTISKQLHLRNLITQLLILFPDIVNKELYLADLKRNFTKRSPARFGFLFFLALLGVSFYLINRLNQNIPVKQIGFLRISANNDVKVFIDDQLVPNSNWDKFELPIGKHSLRLEKLGFSPLQSNIEIKHQETAVINARTK